jgi:hypothetical protein
LTEAPSAFEIVAHYGSEHLDDEQGGPVSERERISVLVTVKAYPVFSETSGESVCVAGIRTDTPEPEWVRLFPIPFRDLEHTAQFRKYDIIDLDVGAKPDDRRPESRLPFVDTIIVQRHVSSKDGWAERRSYIEPLIQPSMCAVIRRQATDGTSLGVFKPAKVYDFAVEHVPDRPAKQALVGQMNLFAPERKSLEVLPYKFRYRFRCDEPDCGGHNPSIIDWELSEAYRSWRHRYPDDRTLFSQLRHKWFDDIAGLDKDLHLFVGNVAKWPTSFLVLGAFYPHKKAVQTSLFRC